MCARDTYIHVPTIPCSYISKPLNAEVGRQDPSSLAVGRQDPSFWAVDQTCSQTRVRINGKCRRSQWWQMKQTIRPERQVRHRRQLGSNLTFSCQARAVRASSSAVGRQDPSLAVGRQDPSSSAVGRQDPSFWAVDQTCSQTRVRINVKCRRSQWWQMKQTIRPERAATLRFLAGPGRTGLLLWRWTAETLLRRTEVKSRR
jgi:hypothetical protein